jgi:hypothetical protein
MPENPPQEPESHSDRGPSAPGPIEHLVAREEDGCVIIVGLDSDNRAVYSTTLARPQ